MTSNEQHTWAKPELRRQRCELSRMIEPGDALGPLMIQALGVEKTHHLVTSSSPLSTSEVHIVHHEAEVAGLRSVPDLVPRAVERWRTRLSQADGARDLTSLHRLGGGMLAPEDSAWPEQLDDLYPHAPLALYFRGPKPKDHESTEHSYQRLAQRLPRPGRTIAIVGSREMTDYGGQVATEIAEELSRCGITTLSGGAYGVDAAAHRGALHAVPPEGSGVPTSAILAGGADRLYPAGNERLLHAITAQGLLLTEMAPGSSPTRHRFLQRNRLIAALSAAVVVVEARWRSGALSTAHHALGLGRPLGAVPGSVFSASSAGCHRLLRETPTELVTDTADVLELVTGSAPAGLDQPVLTLPGQHRLTTRPDDSRVSASTDGLSETDRRVYDALPMRQASSPDRLSGVAGLPVPQLLAGLSRLQRRGLAQEGNGFWRRAG